MSDLEDGVEAYHSSSALNPSLGRSDGAGSTSTLAQTKDYNVLLNLDWSSLMDSDQLQALANGVETTVDFDNGRGDLTLIVKYKFDERVYEHEEVQGPEQVHEPEEAHENEDAHDNEDFLEHDDVTFAAFKVSSTAMIRASPFWEKVFLGPWAESQPGHSKILNYTEDDPKSLEILLNTIHLRFNRVPQVLTLEVLASMAVLTDKFRATSVVGPWMNRWVEALKGTLYTESSETEWIWISWEYGFEDIFDVAYRRLCMNMAIDGMGVPSTSGTLPPTVEEKAKATRESLIQGTLSDIYRYFNGLRQVANNCTSGPNPPTTLGEYENEISEEYCDQRRLECVIAQIGSLFCGLENCGLWPEKAPSEISMSPQELQQTLKGISVMDGHTLFTRSSRQPITYRLHAGGGSCGSFRRIVNGVSVESHRLSISDEQRVRLAKQRSLWDA